MDQKKIFLVFVITSFFLMPLIALAEQHDDEDIEFLGLELEKVLNLGSGILAAILFLITLAAYKRTYNKRLRYVSLALLLFAVKGFMTAHELFISEVSWVDPTASMLDFVIMLAFFLGITSK